MKKNYVEISLPSSHQYEQENDSNDTVTNDNLNNNKRMHIGGFNFLQQNKNPDGNNDVVGAMGVLKEFNKNTSSDNFKANKKYKFGHVNKSFEPSSAYGNVY